MLGSIATMINARFISSWPAIAENGKARAMLSRPSNKPGSAGWKNGERPPLGRHRLPWFLPNIGAQPNTARCRFQLTPNLSS